MHQTVLATHAFVRWLVLLAGLVAVAKMLAGYIKSAQWTIADRRAGLFFTIALDIQFLIGIVLYMTSPLVRNARADMAGAMHVSNIRFFVVEHPALMTAALVIAHVGSVMARQAPADRSKFARGLAFYGLSLVLIAVGIPWARVVAP
jgi:hypothetical protein